MPGKGYSTIGLKPDVLSRLESLTETFYPGMFLPSTMIILMNEVRRTMTILQTIMKKCTEPSAWPTL